MIRAAQRLPEPSPRPSNSAKTSRETRSHHRRLAPNRGALAGLSTWPHGPAPLPASLVRRGIGHLLCRAPLRTGARLRPPIYLPHKTDLV